MSKQKDGAFRLNMHPKDYFQENPFRSDKSGPPDRDTEPKKESLKPFRPSHPAKMVIPYEVASLVPRLQNKRDRGIGEGDF